MKVVLVEFWGGPYDGVRLPVSADMEQVVIRGNNCLHYYHRETITEGPKVRTIFREVFGDRCC